MSDSVKAEEKAISSLIIKTIAVLLVLTGINGVFIVNAVGLDMFEPLKRNLASVQEDKMAMIDALDFSPIITIDCGKTIIKNIETRASSARFVLNHCDEIKAVTNKTNRNRGDIFEIDNKTSTTDFVLLNEGANQIELLLGQTSEVIVINREKPKSSKTSKAL